MVIAGVKEDVFLADIPYPTQFLKLPFPTSPPQQKGPIDSTLNSTTDSETQSSFKKCNINEKRSSQQKRGIGEILWTNKFAIASGALVGWGLYIWDRIHEIRAEQQFKKVMRTDRPELHAIVNNPWTNDRCCTDTHCRCAAAKADETTKALKPIGMETDQEI